MQIHVYNWAVEKLLDDPKLTAYDLTKEFTKIRQKTAWLQAIERSYQDTAIHQARTAADISNLYGNGNLKFRSKKKEKDMAVVCNMAPYFSGNKSVSLIGLGHVKLCEEQPYQYPYNWLHGAKSWMLVDVTPRSWKRSKNAHSVYRLHIMYDLPKPDYIKTGVVAGIDRCITNPTVVCKTDHKTSSYACYDTAVSFRKNESWNNEAQRAISHRNKKSRSTKKIARQRKSYNWHNSNARDYSEWLLAKEICYGVDTIYIEGLRLEAMTRHGNKSKRGLNRGLRYIRHGEILRKVRIVAERMGIRVIEVNPKHTSQECCKCGYTDKNNRYGEIFKCLDCGHAANADGNASGVIIKRGTNKEVPAGEGTFLERRELGRTRKPPVMAHAVPDVISRREKQARNRPATSSAMKHLGRYAYITHQHSSI